VQRLPPSLRISIFVPLITQSQIHSVNQRIIRSLTQNFAQQIRPGRQLRHLCIECRLIPEPTPAESESVIPCDRTSAEFESAQCEPALCRKQFSQLEQKCTTFSTAKVAHAACRQKPLNVRDGKFGEFGRKPVPFALMGCNKRTMPGRRILHSLQLSANRLACLGSLTFRFQGNLRT